MECLEQGSGLIPNVLPDVFAVAPEFDCTEELRVEIDDTDETRPVRYTSDVRLGFLGNHPFFTRSSCSNTSLMVQNEEKANTPSSEATKILSVYSEAMAPPIPNNRKIHQHLVPQ